MSKSENIQNTKDALYNSRVVEAYLMYCKEKYPHVDLRGILIRSGMEEYEVADQGHWFSEEQLDIFYSLMLAATGNENLAREAGRYAASPGTLGVMRQYTLGLLGPARAFNIIDIASKQFTRSATYKSTRLGMNKVEIVVTTVPGISEKKYACDNRIGFFEAIVSGFGIPLPKIEHKECLFEGANCCRYVVTWERNLTSFFKQARDWSAALLTGAIITTAFIAPLELIWLFPSSAVIFLIFSLVHEKLFNKQQNLSLNTLWNSADQLAEQISINYRNSQLAQDVGQVISSKTTIDDVISSVIKVLQDRLDFDRGLILLADEAKTFLEIRGAFGYSESQIDILETTQFRLDNPDSRGVFTHAFHKNKPYLINDVNDIADSVTQKSLKFIKAMEIQSFIACPIILDGEAIGILGVDNKSSRKLLLRSDMNMLMGVAPAIGVSIQNARLIEEQQEQFQSTLKILADSIDARDFLTAGHSEKVAEYAVGIATELGQSSEFIQMIRIASLLHDYGKIGVPDAILKKDGKLTTEEMAMIRTHPAKTGQILERVPFKGIFTQIPAICASHHEKWDGSGYPNALSGDNIPFGARIIAVADFFEAITAKRHYRDPMMMDDAISQLQTEAGKHFEPRLVKALLRYLNKTRVCMLDEAVKDSALDSDRAGYRVHYRTQVSAEVGRIIVSGSSVDISEGGIFIRSTNPGHLDKGTDIVLTFSLPSPEELVRVFGKVAWVNMGTPLPSEKYPDGFGVEFNAMPVQAKQNIASYSSKVAREDQRRIILPSKQHDTIQ